MTVDGYLVVTPRKTGSNYYPRKVADVRYMKTKPTLKAKEIAFSVEIILPDTLWDRPTPEIKIDVPKDVLYNMDSEVAVQVLAPEIADALKLEVTAVQDGLTELIAEKLSAEKEKQDNG